jgi:hypothetical protein
MPRLRAALIVVPLLALPALGTGCAAPPARAEQAPGNATAWRTLGTWSGQGSRQTESFDVVSGAMRLRWQTTASANGASVPGRFQVTLYSAISGRPLQEVVDHVGPGSGTAHISDDPRVSYLVIDADGVEWTAALEEGATRSTAPPAP